MPAFVKPAVPTSWPPQRSVPGILETPPGMQKHGNPLAVGEAAYTS